MRYLIIVALSAALLTAAAEAGEWKIVGTRAQGMGGAHVAVADDATASYWNPAGYAKFKGHQTRIEVGVGLQLEPDMLERAEDIFDFIEMVEDGGDQLNDILTRINNGDPTVTPDDIQDVLAMVADGFRLLDGVDFGGVAGANLGANLSFGRFGVSLNGIATLEATADVDLDVGDISLSNTGASPEDNVNNVFDDNGLVYVPADPQYPVTQDITSVFTGAPVTPIPMPAAEGYAHDMVLQATLAGLDVTDPAVRQTLIDMATALAATGGTNEVLLDNATSITVRGILLKEAAITYGHPFADGKLCLGLNIKGVEGESYYRVIPYGEFGDAEDVLDEILDEENRERSSTIAVDVGVLFQPFEKVRFGLVARNVNSPEFDFEGPGDFEIEPQARLGVAFFPTSNLTLAADIDVTENVIEGLDDLETRFLAVGAEFRCTRLLALRGGANLNLADPGLDELYTLGIGIGAGSAFRIDIAAGLSGDREDLDFDYDLAGLDLPSGLSLSVGVQVSAKF